jgi:hypothetical protein
MSPKPLIAIAILAAPALFAAMPWAVAQNLTQVPMAQAAEPVSPPPHTGRQRITIGPRPLLYRRCTDWYELQNRPSGTVLYPQMRCWWVMG